MIVAISFIFAGAFGNIIDSIFYGIFFDDSFRQVATFLPPEGGYDSLFHGKVVDMLYFPMVDTMLPEWLPSMSFNIPEWLPIIGGNNYSFFVNRHFTFFDPVFNVADSAISAGVAMLIIFNKKVFPHKKEEKEL